MPAPKGNKNAVKKTGKKSSGKTWGWRLAENQREWLNQQCGDTPWNRWLEKKIGMPPPE